MVTSFLAILGFGRSALKATLAWLSRRSLAEIGCIALAVALAFMVARANHWKGVAADRQAQIVKMKDDLAKTRDLVNRKNAELADAAAKIRKANDEENRRIAADAHDLRLSGPGRAVCNPQPAATAGGRVESAPVADAAGSALPSDDRAAVPWGWLVVRATEHDQLRAEVDSWHTWYARLVAAWPKSEEAAAK